MNDLWSFIGIIIIIIIIIAVGATLIELSKKEDGDIVKNDKFLAGLVLVITGVVTFILFSLFYLFKKKKGRERSFRNFASSVMNTHS
jgi:hypothetical protein